MSGDEIDDAIEEDEALVGWEMGMRRENRELRQGIHSALDRFAVGDYPGGIAKLRKLVGRKER